MTLVDVDDPLTDTEKLLALLQRVGGEQEIALRNGKLFCARIDRAPGLELVQSEETQTVAVSPGMGYALELGTTGSLDNMVFVP